MPGLQELHKQVIQEHARKPRNFGCLPDPTHAQTERNPTCGDQLTLTLRVKGDVISDAKFTGKGCAISVASASLMTSLIRGKTVAQALELADQFSAMLKTGEAAPALGDSAALGGVHLLHTRVKCAALGWQALRHLLGQGAG